VVKASQIARKKKKTRAGAKMKGPSIRLEGGKESAYGLNGRQGASKGEIDWERRVTKKDTAVQKEVKTVRGNQKVKGKKKNLGSSRKQTNGRGHRGKNSNGTFESRSPGGRGQGPRSHRDSSSEEGSPILTGGGGWAPERGC